jgi:histone-binding protein RBBP4
MLNILEEYKIWKKNTPFLYDVMLSHALEWPSLTVQFLPDKILPAGCDYSVQRLLLGTHTSGGEANYVHIAEIRLPLEDTEIDARAYERTGDPTADATGAGSGAAAAASSSAAAQPADVGGYAATFGKVEIVQSMLHAGEVHRARVMPQHSHYIATKSPSPDVFVYDRSLHPAKPVAPAGAAVGAALVPTPDFRLVGHDKEGYGLSWNPREAGHLLSGAEDHLICFWDLQSSLSPASSVLAVTHPTLPAAHSGAPTKVLAAAHTYRGHSDIVEDVQWNPHQDGLFASAGDDKLVILWDRRQKETHVVQKVRAIFALTPALKPAACVHCSLSELQHACRC